MIQATNLLVSLVAIAEAHRYSLRLGFLPRCLPECLFVIRQSRIPQGLQIFFPAIEPHLNTIAASIFGEPGMQRLVYIADQMAINLRALRFSFRGASGNFSTWTPDP